ncbi:GerAB/ArcD/ProY family transporter [Texcoconibacillus texcoconensis]|uniref:Spore germination protein KB n=1 Tax=Texcoconibacillus texcoconensis TaxID=1095777 RepID=A0A840QLP4_9BACI|nr:endospore germination permease [Texcoconibacillus texcoconensis]MBB5172287.1 spore germination protein KB [Texcoconibacillus texcoconensis]
MIEKGRISAMQMAILMYPAIIATGVLIVPSLTAENAGRDLWISPIIGSSIGFLTVYLAYKLHQYYPGQTVIQYSEEILGKPLGKAIGFLFLFLYLHLNGVIVREYAEFVIGVFLLNTPMQVIYGTIIIVCAFAVRGGLEVVARTALIFVPVVTFLIFVLIVLLINDLDPTNMLPVFEKGVTPALKGSIAPQAWFSEFFVMSFLLPYLVDQENGLKWGMTTAIFVMVTLSMTNLVALFLFGDFVDSILYPVMSAARYVSVAEFFEHLESVVMALWVAGAFVKICVFYYALSLGTAQWLKLSEYKAVVLPFGFLIIIFARWSGDNLADLKDFLGTPAPWYLLTFQVALPILLIIIAFIKKRRA